MHPRRFTTRPCGILNLGIYLQTAPIVGAKGFPELTVGQLADILIVLGADIPWLTPSKSTIPALAAPSVCAPAPLMYWKWCLGMAAKPGKLPLPPYGRLRWLQTLRNSLPYGLFEHSRLFRSRNYPQHGAGLLIASDYKRGDKLCLGLR